MEDGVNTYFLDPASETEGTRLIKQERIVNRYMDLLPKEFVPWRDAPI